MRTQLMWLVVLSLSIPASAGCIIGSAGTAPNETSTSPAPELAQASATTQKSAPTASARSSPTRSPTLAIPITGGGKILFQDDFSDPSSGWVATDLGDISFGYSGGTYRVVTKKGGLNSHALLPDRTFDNISVEVDATFASGPADTSIYGIICRGKADTLLQSGYEFLITPGGGYGILKVTGTSAGDSSVLGQEGKSSAVKTGNATNHLRVDCSGSNLTLYANGQKLVAEHDSAFQSGQVGFAISSQSSNPGYEVKFDNLVVREAAP